MNCFKLTRLRYPRIHQRFRDIHFARRLANVANRLEERDALTNYMKNFSCAERSMAIRELGIEGLQTRSSLFSE